LSPKNGTTVSGRPRLNLAWRRIRRVPDFAVDISSQLEETVGWN
jgi:hypothetical protein